MIIQCENCSKKFIVKDAEIPQEGRTVQCSYCSSTWHQMPVSIITKTFKQANISKQTEEISEGLSIDSIKASDGKNYKFLGSQWAQLLPSGKTGLFAKRKIGRELDKLTGRGKRKTAQKRQKKIREVEIDTDDKIIDPSSESLDDEKQLSNIHEPNQGLGFFGYIFLLIIIGFSVVGALKTFENDLLDHYPKTEYIFELLDKQLEYISETVKNMIVIVNDLINSY